MVKKSHHVHPSHAAIPTISPRHPIRVARSDPIGIERQISFLGVESDVLGGCAFGA